MYNTSYSNILLLKSQKDDVSFVANKEKMERYKLCIKDNEEPLKIIKRIKVEDDVKFQIDEVYDISQTDAIKKQEKTYSNKYVETMIKGMCSRRGLTFDTDDLLINLENLISDISNNSRADNILRYGGDLYASQKQAEINATVFTIAKKFNINTKDYDLKDVCRWGIYKDSKTLKESLKYIQMFTNYFIKDFQIQEKLYNLENEKQQEEFE